MWAHMKSRRRVPQAISGDYSFIVGNAFERIEELPDDSVQLTVTSPPYNIGKAYERRVALDEYLRPYTSFAKTLFAKTAPSGSVCWQVGNYVDRGEVFPLDYYFYQIFKAAGFRLRNRVIWHFEHGLHAAKRFSGRYETILWFSKSDQYIFDVDPVRVPSKYPGKRHFKGRLRGTPSGNPLGKNPSDFWTVVSNDWDNLIWNIPNVKANHPEKTNHPCQFPIELAQRCVLALTRPRDLILDPFMGVASAGLAALMHDRRFVGFELDRKYVAEARDRVNALIRGELTVRPLGKPVYSPTGRERVAQPPTEWLVAEREEALMGDVQDSARPRRD
jgi:adenine-specific DNA-methyltransferase